MPRVYARTHFLSLPCYMLLYRMVLFHHWPCSYDVSPLFPYTFLLMLRLKFFGVHALMVRMSSWQNFREDGDCCVLSLWTQSRPMIHTAILISLWLLSTSNRLSAAHAYSTGPATEICYLLTSRLEYKATTRNNVEVEYSCCCYGGWEKYVYSVVIKMS